MKTYTASWRTVDHNGVRCIYSIPGCAAWHDETSEYDPFTLRVCYAPDGRMLGGPVVGEFTDWVFEVSK